LFETGHARQHCCPTYITICHYKNTKQSELELNRTRLLVVQTDDFNLLGEHSNAVKKNMETAQDMSKEIYVEIKT
jgi:hypothetical protein